MIAPSERPVITRYEKTAKAMLRKAGVVRKEARGFGNGALTVKGRIFAMVSSRGEFVVKLPPDRVAALTAAGKGTHFDAGRGRIMKEWLAVDARSRLDWTALADEARRFVS